MTFIRLLFLILVFNSCAVQQPKINGLSFVASREAIDDSHANPVAEVGANFVAIMPFGFIRDLEYPEIVHNTERQWFGEIREGAKQYIETLRKKDVKIMIKPQIWVWRGLYTGHIEMNSEELWKTFETSYKDFIMEYAHLAEETQSELFCIGTELEAFVKYRPDYWNQLIKDIKSIYKGKLTYASNWDEFKRTPFWNDLDYIGVDAYFPVSDQKTPTVEDCIKGWKSHKTEIENLSKTYNKPILFTEYGYRSMDFTGKEPWESDYKITSLNFEGQANATQALFETFWNEEWFAGGFVWKWFHNHEKSGGKEDNQFTPQNKPVEMVIKSYYLKD
ncbi:glycoside hydrolase TIM-barrel-like domain-containing protein [Psychroserpens sp. XS_ASV72]|uniref:glycoside hydrolase family 113 n=1 Tax=Psychroserpens sp. XS_ASV72 TaxID=3241293 RepID=UPI0035149212